MLQNQRVPEIACNIKDHSNQYVSAICTREKCQKQSAICQKCMLPFHKHCEDHITYLDEIPNKVKNVRGVLERVNQIFESLIKQLRTVQKFYQKSLEPIQAYEEIPNMVNLNKLGQMFREQYKIDLNSLQQGKEEIIQIIEKQFIPFVESNQFQEFEKAKEWRIKGKEHCDKYEFQEGFECIEMALNFNPNSDDILNDKGDILCLMHLNLFIRNLGRHQEAIKCLDMALQINTNNDSAWLNKGWVLHHLGQFEEAIGCCHWDRTYQIAC